MRTNRSLIMNSRQIVEEVFTKPLADLIWTANTLFVLPLTPQNFAVGSVLPATFYMCRRGCRRGKGRFQHTFSPAEKIPATVWSVSGKLSESHETFVGFESEIQKDILGDLLLCDSLENKKHKEGHHEEIQRAFPVHFFASWLDLPPAVANLRFVPEMLICLLADQSHDQRVVPASSRAPFRVGIDPDENLLLKIFGKGVVFGSNPADLRSDSFDESAKVTFEELLMIRLAQACDEAPETLRATRGGGAEILNCWPISHRAAFTLRDDLSAFLLGYGEAIPRRSITPMLESLLALGLLNVFLECCAIMVSWDEHGTILPIEKQRPFPIFVDASNGSDPRLRDLSEQSFDEITRLHDQASNSLMSARILDAKARYNRKLRDCIPSGPDTSAWLNLLGAIRREEHETSETILNDLFEKIEALADRLETEGMEADAVSVLRSPDANRDPVRVLADSLCLMMGDKLLRSKQMMFLDSCLMINEPHGIGRKRRVSRSIAGRKRKMMDARSAILPNTVLETLVHLHLSAHKGVLSFIDFLQILRHRYGLWVDESPPGVAASREDLLNNRAMLEKRLRDLGLLVGVNDAEFMKHLRPRYRKTNGQ
jgi:hypothetical protein